MRLLKDIMNADAVFASQQMIWVCHLREFDMYYFPCWGHRRRWSPVKWNTLGLEVLKQWSAVKTNDLARHLVLLDWDCDADLCRAFSAQYDSLRLRVGEGRCVRQTSWLDYCNALFLFSVTRLQHHKHKALYCVHNMSLVRFLDVLWLNWDTVLHTETCNLTAQYRPRLTS